MPEPRRPYDPQPEREDALAEAAARGFGAVDADHDARLARLRVRTRGTRRAPRLRTRWLTVAAAAAIAVLVVVGVLLYEPTDRPLAADLPGGGQASEVLVEGGAEATETEAGAEVLAEVTPAPAGPAPVPPAASPQRPAVVQGSGAIAGTPRPAAPAPHREPAAAAARESRALGPLPEVAEPGVAEAEPPANESAADLMAEEQPAMTGEVVAGEAVAEVAASTPTVDSVDLATADFADDAPAAGFELARASRAELREVFVAVTDAGGQPVDDPFVGVESAAYEGLPDGGDRLRLLVPPDVIVGVATAPGYDTVRFELTLDREFTVRLSRDGRALVPGAGADWVAPVAPVAARFAAFDAYVRAGGAAPPGVSSRERAAAADLAQGLADPTPQRAAGARERDAAQAPRPPAREVTVQFEVDRRGRPRRIEAGPGPSDRADLQRARRLLRGGPDWPEAYRGARWRYVLRFGPAE